MSKPVEYRKLMEQKLGQQALVLWLTGMPCSGKTTIGMGLQEALIEKGYVVRMLDGDITRRGICRDLGFTETDRIENIRRIAEISRLFVESGIITINAFITPTEQLRQSAMNIIGAENLVNVWVKAPVEVCEARDVKGMYKKARQGMLENFTGVSAPFEMPVDPDIVLDTVHSTPEENIAELLTFVLPLIQIQE